MGTAIDLTGQRFGKLVALNPEHADDGRLMWRCVCDCGTHRLVRTSSLRDGKARACKVCNSKRFRPDGDKRRSHRAGTNTKRRQTLDEAFAEVRARHE